MSHADRGCHTGCKWLGCIKQLVWWKIGLANKLAPIANLAARILLAGIFFRSGQLKLPSGFLGIGQGDWSSTLYLFQEEYKVPILSPELAAYLSATVEILAPVLLVLGLGTRFAAFLLLVMTGVIEYTYQHSMEHYYWAALSFMLVTYGGNLLSLDFFIAKGCKHGREG